MSRSSKAAKGFITSLMQYASLIVLQALLAPIVLKVAGRETLGAYAAIVQVLALLQLVDIAGSWSFERFLAQAMGRIHLAPVFVRSLRRRGCSFS